MRPTTLKVICASVQDLLPIRKVTGEEGFLELGGEGVGVLIARLDIAEAGVFEKVRPLERGRKAFPILVGRDHDEEDPSPVARGVLIDQGVGRSLAADPLEGRAAGEHRRNHARIRPRSVRHEGARHLAPLAGFLAFVEREHDATEERHRTRVVPHAGRRERGLAVGRPHRIHEPGTRPIRGGVEARFVDLVAVFAVAGDLCVDQRLVHGFEIFVADPQALENARREVGHEYVGAADEVEEHIPRFLHFDVEHDAAFVAVVVLEHVVEVVGRKGRRHVGIAVRIANAGALDLDHLGPEIGHHRGARGPENVCGHVDHPDPGENSAAHRILLRLRRRVGGIRPYGRAVYPRATPPAPVETGPGICGARSVRSGGARARPVRTEPEEHHHGTAGRHPQYEHLPLLQE